MSNGNRWLLPAGIHEELPTRARQLECMRARVLSLFRRWGYEFLIPPLIEYLESLLLSDDEDLRLQTFKLTDQESGRMMGVRADITPQVARIDACLLTSRPINRLCYAGTVLTTRAESVYSSRAPLQFGAEIYGHNGKQSDLEIIRLMLAALKDLGVADVRLDVGHVGVYSALAKSASLSRHDEHEMLDLLQKKSEHDLRDYMRAIGIDRPKQRWFLDLLSLNGRDKELINRARRLLTDTHADAGRALDELEALAQSLEAEGVHPYYDLAELRGYHYKTGVVFAAFTPGIGQEIVRGGRYNGIGRAFGQPRPATGFSSDLKLLAGIASVSDEPPRTIFMPFGDAPELRARAEELRAAGECVVEALHADHRAADYGCRRRLALRGGRWLVEELDE